MVYKTKYNPDGIIERHEACLVILLRNQTEGVDYREMFTPVGDNENFFGRNSSSILGTSSNGHSQCLLHGNLDEATSSFQVISFRNVCMRQKSLYGLKQAPCCSFTKLSLALTR